MSFCTESFFVESLNRAVLEENRSIKTVSETFLDHFIVNVNYLAWPDLRYTKDCVTVLLELGVQSFAGVIYSKYVKKFPTVLKKNMVIGADSQKLIVPYEKTFLEGAVC